MKNDIHRLVTHVPCITELVDGVLLHSMAIPSKQYYVNYEQITYKLIAPRWMDTQTTYHIGPYPKVVAEFILEHWLHRLEYVDSTQFYVVKRQKLALKPREDSIEGPTPTPEQLQLLVVDAMLKPLEVYRYVTNLQEVDS